jgi:RND family efflux transporter MFP subunit
MNKRLLLQILVPLLILAAGAAATLAVLRLRKPPAVAPAQFQGPLVQILLAAPTERRIDVEAMGTVEPYRVVELASQVGGRVVATAPSLRAGGFCAADELLVAIDPSDYDLVVVQRLGDVARAELRVAQERAEAAAAVRAWQQLEGERPAEPLVARAPQLREAEAALAAAEAAVDRARLDLSRTRLLAPFAARIRQAKVEVGQLVQPGQTLAELHDLACAEVRLPISSADAAFVDLPLHWSDGANHASAAAVEIRAEHAGRIFTWPAQLVRTEGEIDRRTRQQFAVARIEAPYARGNDPDRPPLAAGTFVQARIAGRTLAGVQALPRTALRGDDEVWIVDPELHLRRRRVEVLRRGADEVLVRGDLAAGERICTTALATPTEGMPVRLQDAAAAPAQPAQQGGR